MRRAARNTSPLPPTRGRHAVDRSGLGPSPGPLPHLERADMSALGYFAVGFITVIALRVILKDFF